MRSHPEEWRPEVGLNAPDSSTAAFVEGIKFPPQKHSNTVGPKGRLKSCFWGGNLAAVRGVELRRLSSITAGTVISSRRSARQRSEETLACSASGSCRLVRGSRHVHRPPIFEVSRDAGFPFPRADL